MYARAQTHTHTHTHRHTHRLSNILQGLAAPAMHSCIYMCTVCKLVSLVVYVCTSSQYRRCILGHGNKYTLSHCRWLLYLLALGPRQSWWMDACGCLLAERFLPPPLGPFQRSAAAGWSHWTCRCGQAQGEGPCAAPDTCCAAQTAWPWCPDERKHCSVARRESQGPTAAQGRGQRVPTTNCSRWQVSVRLLPIESNDVVTYCGDACFGGGQV